MFKFLKQKNNKEIKREISEFCTDCQSPLVIRKSKYGEFLGCSQFPKCSYTRNIDTVDDSNCFGYNEISFKNKLTIVSGHQICYSCENRTRVSGIGLLFDEVSFTNYPKTSLLSYGYDIYFVPWNDTFEQLPKELCAYILENYPIQYKYSKTTNEKYYANVCEHCGRLQGNNYVYKDTGHGSPFDVWSKEKLILEQISLVNQSLSLKCSIDSDISPTTKFLKRSTKVLSKFIL